eukprot:6144259-Alexandrium_andersonii.AAC.1
MRASEGSELAGRRLLTRRSAHPSPDDHNRPVGRWRERELARCVHLVFNSHRPRSPDAVPATEVKSKKKKPGGPSATAASLQAERGEGTRERGKLRGDLFHGLRTP